MFNNSQIDTQENHLSIIERTKKATHELCEALGISPKSNDFKILTLALAEVATREAKHNPAFAHTINEVFSHFVQEEKVAKKQPHGKRQPRKVPTMKPSILDHVKPINPTDGKKLNPYKPLNPYELYEIFGDKQFEAMLPEYGLLTLRNMVKIVFAQHPTSKKPNLNNRDDMIAYILEQVLAEVPQNPQ
jgi:hypothetical protein